MSLRASGSQTVGPYFHLGLTPLKVENLAAAHVPGERITLRGCVLDGDGKPVPDAMIEIWQANSMGQYTSLQDTQGKAVDPGFKGFGRMPTDKDGGFRFTTIKPGRVPGLGDTQQAPHVVVMVFARGVTKQLLTRVYFPGEASNDEDAVLSLVPEDRRATMIAARASDGAFEWNIVLQGEGETVFFDY